MFFLLFTLFLNIFFSHSEYLFLECFFSLSLEFLLISELYHSLSSSRTTIVLFGIHNLVNSIKTFVNNILASLAVPS